MISTYPKVPYNGYTWPLTQHMGVINESNLYPILWAADNFSTESDPILRINEYLVANNVFTPNIREDSGQPDPWRDYQQILSELGLIYSTEITRATIALTPLGVAFLDKLIDFSELMTLQMFRYQYPNGHKMVISSSLRKDLQDSPLENSSKFPELQTRANVSLRPAVLIWWVLKKLQVELDQCYLTFDEFQNCVMKCISHSDLDNCVNLIVSIRNGQDSLPLASGKRERRNMQDWIKFLVKTPVFEISDKKLIISYYGHAKSQSIDEICMKLEKGSSFWVPGQLDKEDRESWYSFFGSLDLGIQIVPKLQEFAEVEDDRAEELNSKLDARNINLYSFDPDALRGLSLQIRESSKIDITYDTEIADKQHRLHDRMVALIGSYYQSLGASVFFDPKTVDVLVRFENIELLIEVKSVTTKNILSKVRNAIGQVCYYDFLRSKETTLTRRKMIALTAKVPSDAWYIDFLNNHLDIDLLSLDGQELEIYSSSRFVNDLKS